MNVDKTTVALSRTVALLLAMAYPVYSQGANYTDESRAGGATKPGDIPLELPATDKPAIAPIEIKTKEITSDKKSAAYGVKIFVKEIKISGNSAFSTAELKKIMDIPVFHDDQHGTAIISAAGMVNALEIVGKDITKCKIVINGAGAAGIACANLAITMGIDKDNVILCDTKGVIYKGRKEGMNEYKERLAAKTEARTLADAMVGADIFFGVSAKGALSTDMLRSMAKDDSESDRIRRGESPNEVFGLPS